MPYLKRLYLVIACGFVIGTMTITITAHAKKSAPQKPIGARINIAFGPDSEKVAQVKTVQVSLPKGVQLHGRDFPRCPVAQLGSSGPNGCPKASIVGYGYADGYGTGGIYERFAVTAVNGGEKQLLLHLFAAQGKNNGHGGTNPIDLTGLSVGTIEAGVKDADAQYAYRFTFPVPDALLQPITGIEGKLLRISVLIDPKARIKHRGKTLAYATTAVCPFTQTWSFGGRTDFADGQFASIGADIICAR